MWLSLALEVGCSSPGAAPESAAESGRLVLGEVQACTAPAASPSWREVGEERGLLAGAEPGGEHAIGGFVALAELDGRPGLDLVFDYPGETQLFIRDGGGFVASSVPRTGSGRLQTFDSDGDGIDEVVRSGGGAQRLRWEHGAASVEAMFADAPARDGYFVGGAPGGLALFGMGGHYGTPDALFDPDGWQEAASVWPAELAAGHGADATWFDLGADGHPDVYVSNDFGADEGGNELAVSDGAGHFTAADAATGCLPVTSAMGADAADWTGDGLPDLLLTESGGHRLLQTTADGACVELGQAAGLPAMGALEMGWGALFVDLDNDADLDILEAQGDLWLDGDDPALHFDSPLAGWTTEAGRLTALPAAWGLAATGSWRSLLAWDDNDDGLLDVLVTGVVDRPRFFESQGCTGNGWLDVAAPLGSRVEVETAGGVQTSWLTAQSGQGASRPAFVHVGVGAATTLDEVRVTTPDGTAWAAEDVAPRRRVWLSEGPDPWLARP